MPCCSGTLQHWQACSGPPSDHCKRELYSVAASCPSRGDQPGSQLTQACSSVPLCLDLGKTIGGREISCIHSNSVQVSEDSRLPGGVVAPSCADTNLRSARAGGIQAQASSSRQKRYAFVTVLFGNHHGYCVDAAVLGESLRQSQTAHEMLMLHTSDVPAQWLKVLAEIGWELRLVDYLHAKGLYADGPDGRFANVFTKLRVFTLIEYDKVVLLDTDLLVRGNIDSLFERPAPAALRRHAAANFADGSKIMGEEFFDASGNQTGGINAGVMVLSHLMMILLSCVVR